MKTDGFYSVIKVLFVEAHDVYRDFGGFHSTLMVIGTSGTLYMDLPCRLIMADDVENKSIKKFRLVLAFIF